MIDDSWIETVLRIGGYTLRDEEYEMRLDRLGKIVTSYRTPAMILRQYGKGLGPARWRDKKIDGIMRLADIDVDINRQCYAIIDKRTDVMISSDLLESRLWTLITMFSDPVKEDRINTWQEAKEKNVLGCYFGDNDIFYLVRESNKQALVSYSGDYYDFIKANYTMMQRVEMYIEWLIRNATDVPFKYNSYSCPQAMAKTTIQQVNRYKEILGKIDGEIDILSDGAGTCSMACVIIGKKYNSVEPNAVGDIARRLGIIDGLFNTGHTLVVANAGLYEENKRLMERYTKVVVIDEGCKFNHEDYVKVPNCNGRISVKGITLNHEYRYARSVVEFVRDREPVVPKDEKSRYFAEDNGISVADTGFKIGVGIPGVYEIGTRTQAWLGNARVGDVKSFKGEPFEYETQGQRVICGNSSIKYYPKERDNQVVLRTGDYFKKDDAYISEIKHPRRIRFIEDELIMVPVYYNMTYDIDGRSYSIFSRSTFGVKVPIDFDKIVSSTFLSETIPQAVKKGEG